MKKHVFIFYLFLSFLKTIYNLNICNIEECNGCCLDNRCIPENDCKYLFYGTLITITSLIGLSLLIIFFFIMCYFCKLFVEKKKQSKYARMNDEHKEASIEINFENSAKNNYSGLS